MMAKKPNKSSEQSGASKVCWQCGETYGPEVNYCTEDGASLVELDPSETQDAVVGRVFDHSYRVLAKLGEGGMSDVYSAREVEGEREVALKVLKADFLRDEQIRKRFMYEARVIGELDHPNAVDLYDFGQAPDGSFYMVMELLEGESLAERLDREWLTYRELFEIAPSVAAALGEAHDHDVVHRDLKPENVYLAETDGEDGFEPILLDFGIAKHLRSRTLTREDALWGTPGYMSPEQATGDPVTEAADVYSLGVILYEFLTGVLPFRASTPMGYATKHIQKEPTPPSDLPGLETLPEALEELIVDLLEKESDDRPQSMESVADRLREIRTEAFDGETLSTAPAAEVERDELTLVGDEGATGREAEIFEVDAEMMVADTAVAEDKEEIDSGAEDLEAADVPDRSHTARIEFDGEPDVDLQPRSRRPLVLALTAFGALGVLIGGWTLYSWDGAEREEESSQAAETAAETSPERPERKGGGSEERPPSGSARSDGGAEAAQRAAARALGVRRSAGARISVIEERRAERRRRRRRRRAAQRERADEETGDEAGAGTEPESDEKSSGEEDVESETRRVLEETF